MPVRDLLMAASGASAPATYIEDVFSTYLYTGTNATQPIANNIDLSSKGGLVWTKPRSASGRHCLFDTNRGATNYLISYSTSAQITSSDSLTSFDSNGFTLGNDAGGIINSSGTTYASWTFRKQPKFFDIVTFTADGTSAQTINHNLGSVPGFIMIKSISNASAWPCYHQGLSSPNNQTIDLNSTGAASTNTGYWGSGPTSTTFQINTVGISGWTFVAYLFAHNAGGFGTSGTDNVISCGSFVSADSSGGANVNLGYEPQYILVKATGITDNWFVYDCMRGLPISTSGQALYPNNFNAETTQRQISLTATGFNALAGWADGYTFIYMAIRRPMKVPTDATTVFKPVAQAGGGTVTTGFPVDLSITPYTRSSPTQYVIDRLRGTSSTASQYLVTRSTSSEASSTSGFGFDNNTGYLDSIFTGGGSAVYWNFSRRPGFFDTVCYTGDGQAPRLLDHNLGVIPELAIVKNRTDVTNWAVADRDRQLALGAASQLYLNLSNAETPSIAAGFDLTYLTSSTKIRINSSSGVVNGAGQNYVAYLFATCPGVSKVGSYTGTGATQTINCGFTGGARFVLIKRTDSTGNWYVYDTARGMTTLVDPYLLLNSTAAESATLGSVTTTTGGFTVNASILAAINTSGASYIFLAIA